jgi:hypothetical protein
MQDLVDEMIVLPSSEAGQRPRPDRWRQKHVLRLDLRLAAFALLRSRRVAGPSSRACPLKSVILFFLKR